MPEGDTIFRLADQIRRQVGGRTVASSIFRHPRLATLDLAGRTLVDVTSHGKHLFLHWDDGWSLHLHLLMQGQVVFDPHPPAPADEWRRRFELVFAPDEGGGSGAPEEARHRARRLVGIDVPLVHRVRTTDTGRVVDHLGPDLCAPLGPDELAQGLARLVAADPTPLAGALLDQRHLAGFGNIYAVEVPFICGVSPHHPVGEVGGLDQLLAVGAALIRTNARLGPQNTTGRRLGRDDQWILPPRTRHCPRCGATLERRSGDQSPWGRRTAWCPTCQPGAGDGAGVVDAARAQRLLALHPARRRLTFDASTVAFTGPAEPVATGLGPGT